MGLDETAPQKVKKSKKAKRRKEPDSPTPLKIIDHESLTYETKPVKKKKSKRKESCTRENSKLENFADQSIGHNGLTQSTKEHDGVAENTDTMLSKKRKKHKANKYETGQSSELDQSISLASHQETRVTTDENSEKKKKKKRKKENGETKIAAGAIMIETASAKCEEDNREHKKAKKKKKKRKHEEGEISEIRGEEEKESAAIFHATSMDKVESIKKKKKEKSQDEVSDSGNISPVNEVKRKSKIKQTDGVLDNDISRVKETKKKKREKDDHDSDDNENERDEATPNGTVQMGMSKKKKLKCDSNVIDVLATAESLKKEQFSIKSKKEKTKDDTAAHQDHPTTAQTDESTKTETESPNAAIANPVTGQWQGDMFNSAERQNKFLRLLGGMKKDSQGGAAASSKLFKSQMGTQKKGLFGSLVSKSSANTALSASAASELNKRLEDDYNKALNLRLGGTKGSGFGFVPDPAEGKKFHIDINKTKSIQFDD